MVALTGKWWCPETQVAPLVPALTKLLDKPFDEAASGSIRSRIRDAVSNMFSDCCRATTNVFVDNGGGQAMTTFVRCEELRIAWFFLGDTTRLQRLLPLLVSVPHSRPRAVRHWCMPM